MSRYLEEAARALKSAEVYANENQSKDRPSTLLAVADGFATLAAIDKGLLPAEIVPDALRAIVNRRPADPPMPSTGNADVPRGYWS